MRTALVTGAAGAVGGAFVDRLAAAGWTVFAAGRPGPHLDAARARWGDRPAIRPLALDHTVPADVAAVATAVGGRLDLLVNSAAAYFQADGGVPGVAVLEANLAANLVGPYRVIHALLPALEAARPAVILNLGSGAGQFVYATGDGPLGYRASKAGLHMLTASLAATLRDRGVAVHAADPGWVRSRLNPGGSEDPADAVAGMWHLVDLRDPAASGKLWRRDQVQAW